jgi:hypothetical protein
VVSKFRFLGYNAIQSAESQLMFQWNFIFGDEGADDSPKCQLNFSGLHGIITQKIKLYLFKKIISNIKVNQF